MPIFLGYQETFLPLQNFSTHFVETLFKGKGDLSNMA